jgi:hypothetical protein
MQYLALVATLPPCTAITCTLALVPAFAFTLCCTLLHIHFRLSPLSLSLSSTGDHPTNVVTCIMLHAYILITCRLVVACALAPAYLHLLIITYLTFALLVFHFLSGRFFWFSHLCIWSTFVDS